jgi:hypothetical protein
MESIFALYIILGLLVLTGYIVYKLVPAFLRGALFLLAIFGELDCLGIILYVICWITLPWIMAFLSIVFGLLDQDKPKSPASPNSESPPRNLPPANSKSGAICKQKSPAKPRKIKHHPLQADRIHIYDNYSENS